MIHQHEEIILHLSLIDGIGPVAIQQLFDISQNQQIALHDFYCMGISAFERYGLKSLVAQKIVEGLQSRQLLDQELALLNKHNLSFTTILSDDYPPLLKHIYMPPPILYYCGLPLDSYKKNLAIVGARRGNQYAQSVIDSFCPSLVAAGWTVVSGGALGVDSMAHRGVLAVQGATIAVLGSGLLKPYPYQNKRLFEQIEKHGTMVSPFPLLMEPSRGTFPARNRIIAGLSQALLIVQAGERSGALITARYALDQGKEIFVVPGSFNDPLSVGCHNLMREGAQLACSARDIMKVFGEMADIEKPKKGPIKIQNSVQQAILDVCQVPASIDDMSAQLNFSSDEIYEQLFILQVEGVLEQNFLGLFQIKQ